MSKLSWALYAFALIVTAQPVAAQYTPAVGQAVSLWPNGAPGSEKRRNEPELAKDYWVRNVHNPSLTIFRPERQNGAAMIVIPGGGHSLIVWTSEGVDAAHALNR